MYNEPDEEVTEQKDVTSNLYRIVPEVKNTLLTALDIYERLPIRPIGAEVLMAKNSLMFPVEHSSTGTIPTTTSVAPIIQPSTATVMQHSDALREAHWTNTIEVLRRLIGYELAKTQSDEVREILQRILNKLNEAL